MKIGDYWRRKRRLRLRPVRFNWNENPAVHRTNAWIDRPFTGTIAPAMLAWPSAFQSF